MYLNITLRFSKYYIKTVLLITHNGIIIVLLYFLNYYKFNFLFWFVTPDSSKTKDDYKKAIVAIIARSDQPITVNNVLDIFKNEHGFTFPFQEFSCGSYMDFFRLYPDMFKVTNLSILRALLNSIIYNLNYFF